MRAAYYNQNQFNHNSMGEGTARPNPLSFFYYMKSEREKQELKAARRAFKKGKGSREEFLKAFANSKEPRFNIKLIIKA
jgi:hypothetical protein